MKLPSAGRVAVVRLRQCWLLLLLFLLLWALLLSRRDHLCEVPPLRHEDIAAVLGEEAVDAEFLNV